MPIDQAHDARLADAHPAAERHLDADVLTGLHQRRRAVHGDRLLTARELHRAALTVRGSLRYREPLEMKTVVDTGRMPNPLRVVEHALGATGPGVPLAPVGHLFVQPRQVEAALGSRRSHPHPITVMTTLEVGQ